MAERTIPRPAQPPPLRPRSPSREFVGEEEVTRCTDRQLLLRALNEIFTLQHAMGKLTADVAEAKTAAVSANAAALRLEGALSTEKMERLTGDAREAHARQESIPDLENVVDKKLAEHKLAVVEGEAQKLEKTLERSGDRRWSVNLVVITAIVTAVVSGAVATVVRFYEAAARGHW
jgi:hypothetical protein